MHFHTLIEITLALAMLAQVYLFFRIRRAIRNSRRSERMKSIAVPLTGAAILVLFAANWVIMFDPIPWEDTPTATQFLLLYPPAVWSFGSLLSALLLSIISLCGWTGRAVSWIGRGMTGAEPAAVADPERRRFLNVGAGAIATAPFILSGYGAAYASRSFEVSELNLPFGVPLRVVQLSDIHAGIFMNRDEMRRLADQAASLNPDLLLLTGDFISNTMESLDSCVEEMARIHAPYGTFACMGNHDHWYGSVGETREAFERRRIPLLVNENRIIQTPSGPFAVAGIDDIRSGRPSLEKTLNGLDPAVPTLLMSHRPEIFPSAAKRGVQLTLSGHYHGGQVKVSLPGGESSLVTLGTPYPEGLFRIGASHLYVSRGIGTTFSPVRLNARPEIVSLHLAG